MTYAPTLLDVLARHALRLGTPAVGQAERVETTAEADVCSATLVQAQHGQADAKAALVRELQDVWYRYALSILRDPEQAKDAAAVDARADIYALGATLYYLLTGKPPLPAKSADELLKLHATVGIKPPSARVPAVPEKLSAIVMKMLAKRPADRIGQAARQRAGGNGKLVKAMGFARRNRACGKINCRNGPAKM